ncbi:MAG: hypothetical protein IJ723_07325 [Ruminococcus sp.]|nr:hypothetical protein [Ruminococcus sp.]
MVSEPYFQNLEVYLKGREVEVHYSANGDLWAEPVEIRTSQEEQSLDENKARADRHFWVVEHAVPLAVGVYAFAALVIFLILYTHR